MSERRRGRIALGVAAIAIAGALYEGVASWFSANAARAALREKAGAEQMLYARRRTLASTERTANDLQGSLSKAQGNVRTPRQGSDGIYDDKSAVVERNPKLRALHLAIFKDQLVDYWGPMFRALHLSPERIAKFEQMLEVSEQNRLDVQESVDTGALSEEEKKQLTADSDTSTNDAMKAFFGDDYSTYSAYNEMRNVLSVDDLYSGLYRSAAPLTAQQADELVRTLSSNRSTSDGASMDWDGVMAQATGLLSPTQLAELQRMAKVVQLRASRANLAGKIFRQVQGTAASPLSGSHDAGP